MRTCYLTVIPNSKPAIADLTPLLSDLYEVNRINVPERCRGKRHGSDLLRRICDDADAENVTLMLSPFPSGALDLDQLISWYERYGFEMLEHQMVRMPNGRKAEITDGQVQG